MREKYSLIKQLKAKDNEINYDNRLSLMGQGDFPGKNSLMRATMNIKHHSQRLTIDNPEHPFIFNGNENLVGAHSSFYTKTDKNYKVVNIVKKYNELLKGKTYYALYFLYCPDDDSYKLVERQECENLTENFGFDYRNDYLDNSEIGDFIPSNTILYASTSYDDDMNVSTGVNGRILYGVHPAVQDDAIIISESFAKRMISNQIVSKTIPVNENTIFVNLYGDKDNYQGLPNIGDIIDNGILAATRQIRETKMFSDLRDNSLSTINFSSDQIYYGEGEIVDINIYCNNPHLKINKINKQLIQYYNDSKFFYSEIYRACRKIINSGAQNVDREINRWLRRSMEYLDEEAKWDFNDNVFSNLMIQLLLRKKTPIVRGWKIAGRAGNKTVTSQTWPDEEMPYTTTESWTDEYGRVHPSGEKRRLELISNPLAIINRTIPMALYEPSMTFILDRTREYLKTLTSREEQINTLFGVIRPFNPKYADDMLDVYNKLTDRQQAKYIEDAIYKWSGIKIDSFDPTVSLRDAEIEVYEKYGHFLQPYKLFIPKPQWGRDLYVGDYQIGYQYILLLKQSGEKGFSVRSAGAISDESLPEKGNDSKTGRLWHSETPIFLDNYNVIQNRIWAYFLNWREHP